jgi:hypothetical protein
MCAVAAFREQFVGESAQMREILEDLANILEDVAMRILKPVVMSRLSQQFTTIHSTRLKNRSIHQKTQWPEPVSYPPHV